MKKWGGDCERNKFKEAQKERNKHDYFHNLWSDKSGLKGTDVNRIKDDLKKRHQQKALFTYPRSIFQNILKL